MKAILIGLLFTHFAYSQENVVKFGDDEADVIANCFYFEYPAAFKVDPRSGIGRPVHERLPIEEGNLHALLLQDPSGALQVRASTHGYLYEDSYRERGIKSPRDVVLMDYIGNSSNVVIVERKGVEIIRVKTANSLRVFFLRKPPQWGLCFQTLTFSFGNDEAYDKFEDSIEKMIESFVPVFARKPESSR